MQTRSSASHGVAIRTRGFRGAVRHKCKSRGADFVRRHIVIVDSDVDNRDMYTEWFESLGERVTACATTATALEALAAEVPDAVIATIRLRHDDGFAMFEAMHDMPEAGAIPAIALTGCLADYRRAIDTGRFAAVVMIPCAPEDLSTVLANVLIRARRRLAA
jgi:CheY-like chemotaxis protein